MKKSQQAVPEYLRVILERTPIWIFLPFIFWQGPSLRNNADVAPPCRVYCNTHIKVSNGNTQKKKKKSNTNKIQESKQNKKHRKTLETELSTHARPSVDALIITYSN